jgi:predicted DNA-binding transcriptional regulator AlpA
MVKSKPKRAPHANPKTAALASARIPPPVDGYLFEPEVAARCRMTRSQIWKLEHAGQFPKRKRYGFRRVGWVAAEIEDWLRLGIDDWVKAQGDAIAA